MTRPRGGSAARRPLALLAAVLPLAAAALAAGCGPGQRACTGQCQAPFELDVVFHPGTTRGAAVAALRSCQANPTVVRLGRVHRFARSDDARAPLTAAIFTHAMTGPAPGKLVSCLQASPAVITAAFPN